MHACRPGVFQRTLWRWAILPTAAFVALAIVTTSTAQAALTKAEQELVKKSTDSLSMAGRYLTLRKPDEALKAFLEARQAALSLAGSDNAEAKREGEALGTRIEAAGRVLKSRGIDIPEITKPGATPTTPAGNGTGGVSFVNQVAPIFVARCRGCHITNTRGGFNLGTYAALIKGSTAGTVFTPGTGKGSTLIDSLESGDMPRGGGKLSNADIALITKWIDEGAKFDGTDPNASIAANAPAPMDNRLEVVKASAGDKSRYSRDIAPVLAASCMDCHGGQRPAARLGLDNFTRLLAGSRDSGAIVVPGKPADSLLIKKLKGTAGAQMPLRKAPLSADVIAKFEQWIADGAKYDMDDPGLSTEHVANVYAATQMSHDELSTHRIDLAEKNWRLGNPDQAPDHTQTESFNLFGNVGEDRLKEIGQIGEQQMSKVATMLRAPRTEPLFKGRLTVFAFNRRFDYSEYGQMVEKREIPAHWRGHWFYNVIDAYACVYPPQFDEASLPGIMGEQIAGAYLESLGGVPEWFALGVARNVAANIDPKDPRVVAWTEAVPEAASKMTKSDDFLTGKLTPQDAAALQFSFVGKLMENSRAFTALLSSLRKGEDFDRALKTAYRGDAKQMADAWARSGGK